ncbi:MAG: ankyrin repeat domain-containing protein [Wolbachia endosymbiont of Tyrophagus putrescentiae]|nr:ankyrin repeat domain-containing protein [Wolbachia endosymbiont of Tyrophagus putrescentiae]
MTSLKINGSVAIEKYFNNNDQEFNKSIEKYFNNNGQGFNKPYVIKINNVQVKVYSHNLKASKITIIENEIRETINNFKDTFSLGDSNSEKIFKIYIFDDKEDYTHLGGNEGFKFGLGDEGGKCFYRGMPDISAEIYVYQQGSVLNLQHELAHGLTYLATEGKSLPTVLMEGIADYFEHHSNHKFNSQGSSIDKTQAKNLDLNEIVRLEYSPDGEQNSLVYKTGHALIMYLQEKNPSLLKNYIEVMKSGDQSKSQDYLDKIVKCNDDFKQWLSANNTEVAMKDVNALQVTKGEFIATKKEIVDGEIKEVSYYKANIDKIDGESVGSFSPVEHISFYNDARAINRATNDYLDISKEYNFLKVIKTTDGQYKLTYCDKQGNNYNNTTEYKEQALNILLNYDESLQQVYSEKLTSLDQDRQNKYSHISKELHSREISYEQYIQKFYAVPSWYEAEKDSLLNEIINTGLANIKANKQIDGTKILDELVNIDQSLIGDIDLQEGKVFSLKSLGQGITGALSVYDGNTKIGELLSEAGFFKQVEGQTKDAFFFEDILHNLNVHYDGGAYMAITKENGDYKASFVDGRKVERDEYFDKSHLHENELLSPSINHIKAKNLDSLLLQSTKILNHKDSELAKYSDEQKENGVIVEKGKLLDDKGTDRKDDDVYEAVIKQGNESLHAFKNMGFYISEEVKDAKGETIYGSNLFIHDHGKNIRFQLPSDVTHLKLVQKDGGYKLVPATKNGDEFSTDISDEYRYIDPMFAHEYEKRDYSHKHVNIGLVNLDKYELGTLFAIRYDPNDHHIPRNSSGEIVRMNGNVYFTKVKLFHGDEEVGMLSNNFHNFKGKIFFSADYNYSYSDFLVSVSPQVEIQDMQDGSKRITFDQSRGDIGNTDKGYTDRQKVFIQAEQQEQVDAKDNSAIVEQNFQTKEDTEMQSDQPMQNNYEYNEEHKATGIKQQLIQKLFPNQESVVINNNLTIEVKYGEGMKQGYTYEYMKEALKEAYEDWCQNFYTQKNNNEGPAKIQLYVFKNHDDYKKYIKELSGKDFWRGGTIREHEPDGTIAKTFMLGGGSLPCSKSSYLMEQMSDAFLEYATGNLDAVPKTLSRGMSDFMWSYGFAKQEKHDMYHAKETFEGMKKQGCITPENIINVNMDNVHTGDIAMDDIPCIQAQGYLVKFLQHKYPSLISDLIRNANKFDIKAGLEKSLKSSKIEREFKEWMFEQSGEKIVADLVPNSDSMLLENYKIKVDIKYDKEKLSDDKLASIKDAIQDSVKEYDSEFNVNAPWYDRSVSVFIFNTEKDYQDYLKTSRGDSFYEKSSGVATVERGNFHVHLYIQDNFEDSRKTLKHEMGHALNTMNSYHGTGIDVPLAMHEGIANYIASLENSNHVNDHGDIEALAAIKKKDLKADEILRNNYKGEHYYSEAEQVIKFLEDKHPDLLDNLLKTLSTENKYDYQKNQYEYTREEYKLKAHKSIEDFMNQLKNYNSEFKEWVEEQISNQDVHARESLYMEMQSDQPMQNNYEYNEEQPYRQLERVTKAVDDFKHLISNETILEFVLEKGKPINDYYYSVRIKLSEYSKKLLQERLGEEIQFSNLDDYINLDPNNFRICYNEYAKRYELDMHDNKGEFVMGDDGRRANVLPLTDNTHFIIKAASYDASKELLIKACGLYDYYPRDELIKYSNYDEFFPTSNVLSRILSNKNNISTQEVLSKSIRENVNTRDEPAGGLTLLHKAISSGDVAQVKYLIDHGANVDIQDNYGNGPLHMAAIMGAREIADYLIEHGADIEMRDTSERTPLMCATKYGQLDVIKYLVGKGANIDIKDYYGLTLQGYADHYLEEQALLKSVVDQQNHFSGGDSYYEKVSEETLSRISTGKEVLNFLYTINKSQEMQSDQPVQDAQQKLSDTHKQTDLKIKSDSWTDSITEGISNVINWPAEGDEQLNREKRAEVLKDTILKIEKSSDQDLSGKLKANVVINYRDIKSLYDKAQDEEKSSVLEFWNKLHVSEYKVGTLPIDKYYFKQGEFFIHDDQEKKCIVLPEDKINIKIMKLGSDYNLVISNSKGDVINSIDRVDNLNYELLSGSGLSLETQDSMQLADQYSEYDLYLINGLGGKIFDYASDHNDYNLIS